MEPETLLNVADIYGTPVYVYELEKIKYQANILKNVLPEKMEVFYSIKANPCLALLSFIKNHVYGVEVSSEGELFIAMYTGIPPEKIIFVGPGKTDNELKYAVENNILSIVIESFEELIKVNHISKQLNKRTRISVRINPKFEVSNARIKMGGLSRQFGIDEEYLPKFCEEVKACDNVLFTGLHIYVGTQILNAEVIVQNFKGIFEIAKTLKYDYGIDLKLIDFGGGFGIPYFPADKNLDLELLKKGVSEVFDKNRKIFDFKNMLLAVEAGRFLVAESGVFLTKVLYKKHSRGKIFVITDGGSNNHASAAGIGRFIRNNFPLDVISRTPAGGKEIVDVVGPLCTPTDVLAQNVELPIVNEGDIIAILKSGAYGLTASMKDFLSHTCPAEVLIDGNEHRLARRRGTKQDFLSGQVF